MDDPSRMTVIYSIDELEHEELDLIGGNSGLMFGHVLLQVVV